MILFYKKDGFITRLNLKELNLESLENYDRYDLTEKLLAGTVYNEYSSIKILSNKFYFLMNEKKLNF
jgi:hypothetical protein